MKIWKLLLPVSLILAIAFTGGCQQEEDKPDLRSFIESVIYLEEIPEFEYEDYQSAVLPDGSVETFAAVRFTGVNAAKILEEIDGKWKDVPISTTYGNFYDYTNVIPGTTLEKAGQKLSTLAKSHNAKYTFTDKSDEFFRVNAEQIKKDKQDLREKAAEKGLKKKTTSTDPVTSDNDPRIPDYAFGFTCGFYDLGENIMYVYVFAPEYNISYLRYT